MMRWWSVPVLLATPMVCLSPAPAVASVTGTVSIIMTTLGTDGAPVVTSMEVPPDATLQLQANCPEMPTSTPTPTPPTDPATPSSPSGNPTGGSGNPSTEPTPPPPPTGTDTSVPPPVDTSEPPPIDEPLPPVPPVVEPEGTPIPPTTPAPTDSEIPDDNSNPTPPVTSTSETPEPASLTLLGLAALGGIGYQRRRRSAK